MVCYLLILCLPVADLRPVSWRTCWRTCRVAASSSCLGASHQSEDQPPLRPPLPLCRLVPLWTNRPSSATSCRWQTAATAAAAPPTSTEPSLPSALQVRLQQCVCVSLESSSDDFWLLKMFRNLCKPSSNLYERLWIPSSYLCLRICTILYITNKEKEKLIFPSAGFNGARPGQPGRGAPPVRSASLESSMGPNPNAGRPFPPQHRNNNPYLLQQQQQQGMMGTHTGMTNQAAMANPGQAGKEIVSCRSCLKLLLLFWCSFINKYTLTHTLISYLKILSCRFGCTAFWDMFVLLNIILKIFFPFRDKWKVFLPTLSLFNADVGLYPGASLENYICIRYSSSHLVVPSNKNNVLRFCIV